MHSIRMNMLRIIYYGGQTYRNETTYTIHREKKIFCCSSIIMLAIRLNVSVGLPHVFIWQLYLKSGFLSLSSYVF
jgi:hypothetical protein